MLKKILNRQVGRRFVAILLMVSLFIPMTLPLGIMIVPDTDGAVLTTLNVCESGGSMASMQGHTPCIPETGGFLVPLFFSTSPRARQEIFPLYILHTSIDRPPRIL